MLILIKNADVYAPEPRGICDVLVEGGKVAQIARSLNLSEDFPGLRIIDAQGKKLVPGFLDIHVHILGGGGEDGYTSRSPESRITDFTTAGVTTVLALLGTDGIGRSLESLYAKCRALNEYGITCYMLTGSYGYPSATLTGNVERDLYLIDRVIGAKIALSDHRSSELTYDELLRLATMVRRGGLLTRKAGLLTIHMGDGKDKLCKLFRAAREAEIPLSTFLPTHVARNEALLKDAIEWMLIGGNADFTAGEDGPGGTARYMMQALDAKVPPERMTLSSDAFGSQPRFDKDGNCIGLSYVTSHVLLKELRTLVQEMKLPLETALSFLTANPARVLHLEGKKGCISPGADADLLLMDDSLNICSVYAQGVPMIEDGKVLVKDRFES